MKLRDRQQPSKNSSNEPVDKALMFKGKGNKGGTKGKGQNAGRQWNAPDWTQP